MPVLLKTDQGRNLYQACELLRELVTDVEIYFDMTGMRILLHAEPDPFTMVLKAEDTKTYEYSSEQPQITTKLTYREWRDILRLANEDGDLITFFVDERIHAHVHWGRHGEVPSEQMEVTIEHKGGLITVINPIKRKDKKS